MKNGQILVLSLKIQRTSTGYCIGEKETGFDPNNCQNSGYICDEVRSLTFGGGQVRSGRDGYWGRDGNQPFNFRHNKFEMPITHPSGVVFRGVVQIRKTIDGSFVLS